MNVFIDSRFEDLYRRDPLVLVDVGARGGLKSNWAPVREHLRLIGFEPDRREYDRLASAPGSGDGARTVFPTALHNTRGSLPIYVARDRGLTSIFEPNRAFLDAFPEADRFDTVEIQQVEADTLDRVLEEHGIAAVDFIKADTQGSEVHVLEGASRSLASSVIGVEVEVEFAPIYIGQPLFAEVDRLLRGLGFELLDLRPCYWKRAAGRTLGGPRGQIVWGDALYLKGAAGVRLSVERLHPDQRKIKVLKALSISVLYGYFDYALGMAKHLGDVFTPDESAAIEARLTEAGAARRGAAFPGRRALASVFHRLWKLCLPPPADAWSVSRGKLGNLE